MADEEPRLQEEPMLEWFAYEHLPPKMAELSKLYCRLAKDTCRMTQPGNERTMALRKLLEAKDAAVRARIKPGG